MFDLTSTYVEGEQCSLAEFGYNRDKKRGKKQINWGLLTDEAGRPIGLDVFPGNTSDRKTLLPQVEKIRERFGIKRFTIVGDRGMISNKHIEEFSKDADITWITALKTSSLKPLVASGVIQPSLFEQTNLCEFTHADYPGERLVACRNPLLARKRAYKRTELLAATTTALEKIKTRVDKGKLVDAGKIGEAVGRATGKYKMAKHIITTIKTGSFEFSINQENVDAEAKLDGIYVIRTNASSEKLPAAAAVRAYKNLAKVERDFRISKSADELQVRPIHHHLPDRVKAHLFICMLAQYVRWHMEAAWTSLTFKDEHPDENRDPVAPAERSEAATIKTQNKTLPDGTTTHSFRTLLNNLSGITSNTCTYPGSDTPFQLTTSPSPKQQEALDLLQSISL